MRRSFNAVIAANKRRNLLQRFVSVSTSVPVSCIPVIFMLLTDYATLTPVINQTRFRFKQFCFSASSAKCPPPPLAAIDGPPAGPEPGSVRVPSDIEHSVV